MYNLFDEPDLQLSWSCVETTESCPIISDQASWNHIASTVYRSRREWYLHVTTAV